LNSPGVWTIELQESLEDVKAISIECTSVV